MVIICQNCDKVISSISVYIQCNSFKTTRQCLHSCYRLPLRLSSKQNITIKIAWKILCIDNYIIAFYFQSNLRLHPPESRKRSKKDHNLAKMASWNVKKSLLQSKLGNEDNKSHRYWQRCTDTLWLIKTSTENRKYTQKQCKSSHIDASKWKGWKEKEWKAATNLDRI